MFEARALFCSAWFVCALLLSSWLPAQVIINEVMAARQTIILDDDEDNSDWLELFNAGDAPMDLFGYGLSDRVSGREPWRFPEVRLEPDSYLLVWCSGKDRTFPASEFSTRADSPLPFTAELVTLDDPWRYLPTSDADTPYPEGWENSLFDDRGWKEGLPGFGFADDDDRTEVPTDTLSILLRHTFEVPDPRRLPNLLLRADFDDAFVVYLNGERVLSVNFPDDVEPDNSVRARGVRETGRPERFDLSPHLDLIEQGPNLLAIVVLNSTPGRGDLSMIPELGTVPPVFHANFKLSSGETVVLSDAAGQLVDAVRLPAQVEHRSYGRVREEGDEFRYLYVPTPLEPNRLPVSSSPPEPVGPEFLPPGGRHTTPFTLSLATSLEFSGPQIWYTLDGTPPLPAEESAPGEDVPVGSSVKYEGPFALREDVVVRARVFLDGRPLGPIQTHTYYGLSDTSREFELPVFSIAMDPGDFQLVQNNALGRGRGSEREAHLELFNGRGELQAATGFGLRLAGRSSRNGDFAFKKAYRGYFRSVYGASRLELKLFPDIDVDSFDQIAMRPSHSDRFRQDINGTLIRDQVMRDLHEDMGGVVSHGTWYNLLVNGRFLGVYNVMERVNGEFFESHFPDLGDAWDVLNADGPINGTAEAWRDLLDFVATRDLSSDVAYRRVSEQVDIDNFTSYMILNIWAQNHDWPGNNYIIGRPRREDGRWVFLSWDAEFAMAGGRWGPKGFDADTFALVMANGSGFATILKGLLENAGYREYFLSEVERYLETFLSVDHVLARIRRQGDFVAPDIPEEAALAEDTFGTWQRNMDLMEEFVRRRGPYFAQFVHRDDRFSRPQFLRGDADDDGDVTFLDAISILRYASGQLLLGGCDDRLDVDDSGRIDLTDGVALLRWLFGSSVTGASPLLLGECSVDAVADDLRCEDPFCP